MTELQIAFGAAEDRLGRLQRQLHGRLILRTDPEYEQARRVYNGMIDRRPLAVARCAGAQDVAACVEFARESGLPLAVRGGGHSGPGLGTCDEGLVCDLGALDAVEVDADRGIVRAGGGCTQARVDAATHPFGLAVPAGTIGSTGIGGLTLGGGHGYLSRKYGLTVDNLLAAEVVLADGRIVEASASEHPDLFWALRGGGGNFGVVTRFTFQARPVAQVTAGPVLWPLERWDEVAAWYESHLAAAGEDLYGFLLWLTVPPVPHFPAHLHGQKVCGVVWCWLGSPDAARAAVAPPPDLGPPAIDLFGEMPFPMLQGMFDPLIPPGLHWYWKGDFVDRLDRGAIAAHLRHAGRAPTPLSQMHLYPIDGAVHRVAPGETAFHRRDARWSMVIVGVGQSPEEAPRITSWARDYWQALRPHSGGAAYVNFLMEEGRDRIRLAYGENYDRLAAIKRVYDPQNLFRVNQNIEPAR